MRLIISSIIALILVGCIQGPVGPAGKDGVDGQDGNGLDISTTTGTVLIANYQTANVGFYALYLPGATSNSVVLFFGIQGDAGVYANQSDWSSIIYAAPGSNYSVNGVSGYYVLMYDSDRTHIGKNYRVMYIK